MTNHNHGASVLNMEKHLSSSSWITTTQVKGLGPNVVGELPGHKHTHSTTWLCISVRADVRADTSIRTPNLERYEYQN